MWVGLFYPLSKYTSAPHRSQSPLSLLCRRGEHGYPGIKAPLASGSGSCSVPGAPAAPAQNPKPRCPGEGMSPGPGWGRTGPPRAGTSSPGLGQSSPRARRCPRAPRQRVSQRQGACPRDGLLVSFALRSVRFLFSAVSDEVCRIHQLTCFYS